MDGSDNMMHTTHSFRTKILDATSKDCLVPGTDGDVLRGRSEARSDRIFVVIIPTNSAQVVIIIVVMSQTSCVILVWIRQNNRPNRNIIYHIVSYHTISYLDNMLYNAFGKIFKTYDRIALLYCMFYLNCLPMKFFIL